MRKVTVDPASEKPTPVLRVKDLDRGQLFTTVACPCLWRIRILESAINIPGGTSCADDVLSWRVGRVLAPGESLTIGPEDVADHIAVLEQQLAAQRAIVTADDAYFRSGDRCLTSGRPTHELGAHAVACLKARDAAKGVDDAADKTD